MIALHLLAITAAASLSLAQPADTPTTCCDEHDAPTPHVQHAPAQVHPDPAGNKFPVQAMRSPAAQPRKGQLAIQAVQGTAGAPPIGEAPVTIELYHRGSLFDTIEAALDRHGVLVLEELPVSMGIQPVVKIKYEGMTYQQVGELMSPSRPDHALKIYCYEPVVEPPPWTVSMRHVVLEPAPEGLNVTEVVVVENPTDRTWIGTPPPPGFTREDGEYRDITTIFPLSENARGVALGRGFHDWCCSELDGSLLVNHLPLTPGRTEMVFGYVIRSHRGAAVVDLLAAADTQHLIVLVPDESSTTGLTGLTAQGADHMGESTMRMYIASNLAKGETVAISLGGLGDAAARASANFARLAAAVGGAAILIIAAFILFIRPRQSRPIATQTA